MEEALRIYQHRNPNIVIPGLEAILNAIEKDPSNSIRKVILQLEVSPQTICKVLKRNFLDPYNIQRVQTLLRIFT